MVWFEYDDLEGELQDTLEQLASQEAHLLETQRTIGLLESHAERLRRKIDYDIELDTPEPPPIQLGDPEPLHLAKDYKFRSNPEAPGRSFDYYRSGDGWRYTGAFWTFVWSNIPDRHFPLTPIHK